jgi:hypothetical protein
MALAARIATLIACSNWACNFFRFGKIKFCVPGVNFGSNRRNRPSAARQNGFFADGAGRP